jgi:hypothetical protein
MHFCVFSQKNIIGIHIITAGFRGVHCDAALRKVVQPPIISEQQYDQRDPDPCPPEVDEFFEALDADSMEETISKLMDGLEALAQERSGFDDIHRLIQRLPLPVTKAIRSMTHAQAIEAQLLPDMTEDELKRFTPFGLLLYKHALEYCKYKWTAEQLKTFLPGTWWQGSPLTSLFLAGNSTLTIQHKRKDSGFPHGCADAAPADGRRGSDVYARLTCGCGVLLVVIPAWVV